MNPPPIEIGSRVRHRTLGPVEIVLAVAGEYAWTREDKTKPPLTRELKDLQPIKEKKDA